MASTPESPVVVFGPSGFDEGLIGRVVMTPSGGAVSERWDERTRSWTRSGAPSLAKFVEYANLLSPEEVERRGLGPRVDVVIS
jgi:hypothetical protein